MNLDQLLSAVPRRTAVGFACATASVYLFHALVLGPQVTRVHQIEGKATELRVQQASALKGTSDLLGWMRGHREWQTGGRDVDSVSQSTAVPELLQRLSDLANRHGVQVCGIRPDPPEPPVTVTPGDGSTRTYARIPVHFVARASYRDLGTFLAELSSQDLLTVVRTVHLTVDAKSRTWNVELVVDAYGRIS